MLDIQYRMNPEICSFPNKVYYFGKLRTQITPDAVLSPLFPYLVFNINTNNTNDYLSIDEVQFVTSLLQAISQHISESGSKYNVGIITPYNGQKAAFNNAIKHIQ